VTSYALSGDPGSWPLLPPIGRPITNARIFLRDENQEPVQNDATGEIYIGGPVLARGYLNQPGFTSDRFILGVSGERLYRTGDLGKLLPSGDFQFLGRRDHQVKIRGVRVELGEIEAIIAHCPGVAQAAVCPRIVSAGDTRLHAYVVSDPSVPTTPGELRKYLETRVPSQLVPSAFVLVPEIPLTATGKVDRLALKSLSSPSLQDVENDAGPSMISLSETHRELVSIWETLLEHRAIGVGENFFEIGGDSLLAVQLSAEIERAFGKKLSVTSIFEHPSIEELVALILDDSPAEVSSGFEAVRTTGSKVPLFCIPTLLDLGRALGPEQPVYGFAQSEILEIVQTLEDPREVVAEVAARWLDEIRKVQPRGPYHLAGHSFGGVVAFEAAARLEEQGEKVALLALLEPDPPKPSSKTSLKWISTLPFRVLRRFFEIGPSGRFSYLIRRARLGRDQLASKFQAAASFADMEPLKKLDALVGTYRARKHNGRITLFCARDNEKGFGAVPALEWKNAAAGEIEIHDVPGDHLTIIRRPNVVTLAKILSSCIGKTPLICVFSAVLPVLHA
jgi:thioesterase domain-containing protein/acyl carrier protein